MVASLITRAVIIMLGYVYPAYECFKCVEKNRPDVSQLRFWCQYWILIAVITVLERLGDAFVSWLPMYCEAKLAFIIYLWYPKTKGTMYVYSTFLKPFVANHEQEIDRQLNELRTRSGDLALQFWHRASIYCQSRLMEFLQYIASHAPRSVPQAGQSSHEPVVHQSSTANYQGPSQPQGHQQPPSSYPLSSVVGYQRPPSSYSASSVVGYQRPPSSYPVSSVVGYQQPASSYPLSSVVGDQQQSSGYEGHTPSAYPGQVGFNLPYQPSAPMLPTSYQPQALQQQSHIRIEEVDHEIMETKHARVTEPVVTMPAQRTRGRPRSRKHQ